MLLCVYLRNISKVACVICFAICLALDSGNSAPKTASGTVTAYSVSLYGIAGYHSSGFYWDIYFSTFDGIDNAWPQGFSIVTGKQIGRAHV